MARRGASCIERSLSLAPARLRGIAPRCYGTLRQQAEAVSGRPGSAFSILARSHLTRRGGPHLPNPRPRPRPPAAAATGRDQRRTNLPGYDPVARAAATYLLSPTAPGREAISRLVAGATDETWHERPYAISGAGRSEPVRNFYFRTDQHFRNGDAARAAGRQNIPASDHLIENEWTATEMVSLVSPTVATSL